MKTPKVEILGFMKNKPETISVIGYGSGINPQRGQENRKPQIDLIVVVDDLKKWHALNIKKNPKDYSFSGKLFFKYAPKRWLRSGGKITYMTYIPFNGSKYKIGTIEKDDFLNDLKNWETFYMAGRMQKPVLVVDAPEEIESAIEYNRHAGLLSTELLLGQGEYDEEYFYTILAGLSYIGDTRMGIAENPDKVLNIVKGRFDFYHDIYGSQLKFKDNMIVVPDESMETLPDDLHLYLENYNGNIGYGIREFLTKRNKSQSMAQTIKGLFTTGPIRSIKYVAEKLKRKRKK